MVPEASVPHPLSSSRCETGTRRANRRTGRTESAEQRVSGLPSTPSLSHPSPARSRAQHAHTEPLPDPSERQPRPEEASGHRAPIRFLPPPSPHARPRHSLTLSPASASHALAAPARQPEAWQLGRLRQRREPKVARRPPLPHLRLRGLQPRPRGAPQGQLPRCKALGRCDG